MDSITNARSIIIGKPDENDRIFESFYISHNYFRRGPEGSDSADCLLCENLMKEIPQAKRRKTVIKITNGSPKGMIRHLNSYHPETTEKIAKQKITHEAKKASFKAAKAQQLNVDQLKQSTLTFGADGKIGLTNRLDQK